MEIGLEHPFEPGHAIGIVPLANRALCASAINRRAWGEGLHHVIDGRTGRPGSGIVATWTIADDALIADGMATALFFADPQRLVDDTGFSWLRMYENGTVDMSPDFPGTLFFHQPRKASA
jgi:thiamine biosynthesis lipoprotein